MCKSLAPERAAWTTRYGQLYRQLTAVLNPEQIKIHEPMRVHTYSRIGGPADIAVFPRDYHEVKEALALANRFGVPHWIVGNGSNLLVRDGGVSGMAIILTGLTGVERRDDLLVARAGVPVIALARIALKEQLSGLEFASGIPGSVGGAVRMNAGAYGGQMSDILESAVVLTMQGDVSQVTKGQLGLVYRDSAIEANDWVVLEGAFRLRPGDHRAIQDCMDDLGRKRRTKQPLEYPSCGSVFKRPPGDYAGRLIQASGLQGMRIGGAQVSTKHAGFIVNVGHASCSDYVDLIRHVQAVVKREQGVELELEVKIVGDD
ncbi:UDP-N-acetylmuramate dehydrogenase [Sulfobacillus harzensis]|uniref:UDP-N-acetylenolpyruvoylglucosamine reductase n=1 Tax=Sulfobacillus harzensis TaxID=2729629 RepID=A0A7Y0Q3R4_9FIRM|nr:UDP-N-acetylmuramate dehydrogenase [Sulfobacillus harzensis]NMP23660.1 UDP-N-acetylmuramate dehydrogenase [Sulfobacillus harzensis]